MPNWWIRKCQLSIALLKSVTVCRFRSPPPKRVHLYEQVFQLYIDDTLEDGVCCNLRQINDSIVIFQYSYGIQCMYMTSEIHSIYDCWRGREKTNRQTINAVQEPFDYFHKHLQTNGLWIWVPVEPPSQEMNDGNRRWNPDKNKIQK